MKATPRVIAIVALIYAALAVGDLALTVVDRMLATWVEMFFCGMAAAWAFLKAQTGKEVARPETGKIQIPWGVFIAVGVVWVGAKAYLILWY